MYSNLPLHDLLAITVRESSAVELMANFPTVTELAQATEAVLKKIKGLGQSRARRILAAIELGRRMYAAPADINIITSPQDVYDLLTDMQLLDREHFRTISLNTKNHVLAIDTISIGTLNSSLVHPREVFKMAVKRSANSIILIHNHPSGDPTPSKEDLEITKRLAEAGKLLGVEVVDHIILGAQRYISLKSKALSNTKRKYFR